MLVIALTLPLKINMGQQVFEQMCDSNVVENSKGFLEFLNCERMQDSNNGIFRILLKVKEYNRGISDWFLHPVISKMCENINHVADEFFSYVSFDSLHEGTYTMHDLILRQKINEDYQRKVLTAHKNNIEDIYKRLDKLWGETAIGIAYVDKQIQLSGMNDFYSMLFQLKNEIEPFLDKEILFERDVQPTH